MSGPGIHRFMLADFAGIAIAFLLFSGLTVFPGYTLGWLTNALSFRKRAMPFRLAIGLPLSIALGPLLSFLCFSLDLATALYAALSLPAIVMMARSWRRIPFLLPAAAWCVWAALALSDLQIAKRLYFSVIGFDYAVRTAFVSSISAFGLPARNPFFFPGHPVGLRYHYFWLIQSAIVHKLATPCVDARQATIGGTLWCGIALMATGALYLRFFPLAADEGRRRFRILLALLAVTGLDILPALFFLLLFKSGLIGVLPPSMEWWNDQVDGWLYTMLWEPHYVAALIACLFGFLVISHARSVWQGALAGLAFATAVGAGIYVAFVFAVFLAVWSGILLWKHWYAEVRVLAVAGVTAALFSLPFLVGLRGPGAGGAFLQFTVRSFFLVDLLHFAHVWQTHLGNLLMLPLNYFLELGLYFVAGVVEWRRLRNTTELSRNDFALGVMAATSLLACTFLRSGVISNNDLGWRGFLIAQFVLLIRGAQSVSFKSKGVISLAILGFAGTLYDQSLLRFYPVLSDAKFLPKIGWLAHDEKLGARTYANREAYEWLRANSADTVLIQQNPNPVIQDSFYGLYANRATLAEDVQCAATFGGDPKQCAPLLEVLTPLFAGGSFENACPALPMEFVIAKDTDGAWGREDSWIWRCPPVFSNAFVRVFRCHKGRQDKIQQEP